jgi:Xaa-Pro aminopeptidase
MNRISEIKDRMKERNIGALILFPSSNQYYLTGFRTFPGERLLLTIIPLKGDPFFIAPMLYESQVRKEAWIKDIVLWSDEDNAYEVLKRTLVNRGMTKYRFAADDTMWSVQLLSLINTLPEAQFLPMGNMTSNLRLTKSAEEVDKIRRASKIVDEVVEEVRKNAKPAMTEIEIAALMEFEMRKRGSEGPSFETIVGSGPNSALPHYNAGERKVENGEFIVLDFGAIYKGYCSDTTRTLCMGEPTDKMREVYNTVKEAQEIGVRTARPGIKASEVDKAVRKYITDKGYGQYFTHRTGHGLGLEVHEEPYISGISETILEPGMAFSIEPGIYIEGEFGVRIEDIVVVTEDGCERMNNYTRELTLIK